MSTILASSCAAGLEPVAFAQVTAVPSLSQTPCKAGPAVHHQTWQPDPGRLWRSAWSWWNVMLPRYPCKKRNKHDANPAIFKQKCAPSPTFAVSSCQVCSFLWLMLLGSWLSATFSELGWEAKRGSCSSTASSQHLGHGMKRKRWWLHPTCTAIPQFCPLVCSLLTILLEFAVSQSQPAWLFDSGFSTPKQIWPHAITI